MKPTIITLPKRLLDAAQKPDCHTPSNRRPLTGAYVDATARRVVAANGLIMAMIPIPGDEPIVAGFISPELWKFAKVKNSKAMFLDYVAGTLNGLPLDPPDHFGAYPPYGNAIPQYEPAYRFHLDPDFISSLASAMGHDQIPLTLEFPESGNGPVRAYIPDPNRGSTHIPTGVFMSANPKTIRNHAEIGLLTARPAAPQDAAPSERSDTSATASLQVSSFKLEPSTIIPNLMRIAGELRQISNMETDAPRLIRDYLELVPVADLDAMEQERDDAIAAPGENLEKAEKEIESLHQTISDRDKRIEELTDELEAAKENAGSPPASRDEQPYAALLQSQARVRELETQMQFQKSDYEKRINLFADKVKDLEARIVAALAARPVKSLDDSSSPKAAKEKPPVPMATRPPALSRNARRNGIELRFDGKPDDATRDSLKARGWRWLPSQPGQPWAVRYSEEEFLFANHLATGDAYTPMPVPPAEPPPPVKTSPSLDFLAF